MESVIFQSWCSKLFCVFMYVCIFATQLDLKRSGGSILFMSPTLSSGTYLCARRRWLCNTFHTSASSYFNREKLNERKQKLGDQHPSSPPKGIKRKTTGPSVVEKSKIRQHLDHIESTKDNLSLQDVERYKPGKALDFRQPTYDQKYKEIQNALIQSFTKPQLRRFLKLYGVSLPSGCKGKNNFAEILLKQWGLEPLDKVKEERTDWQEKSERCKSRGYVNLGYC